MALTGLFKTSKIEREDADGNVWEEWIQYPEHDNEEDNLAELIAACNRLTGD